MSDNKTMTDEVILQVKDLKTYFYTDEGVVKLLTELHLTYTKVKLLVS